MSATPNTDLETKGSETRRPPFHEEWVRADFARGLELELHELRAFKAGALLLTTEASVQHMIKQKK